MRKRYNGYCNKTAPMKIIATFNSNISTDSDTLNSKFNLKRKYCPLGVICVRDHAKIFMTEFNQKHSYPQIKHKLMPYH